MKTYRHLIIDHHHINWVTGESLKGKLSQKMKILSSFTHLYVVPNLTFFLLQNIKEDILRNVSFYFFHTMEVNGNQNWCPAEERKDHFISVVY